MQPCLSGCFCLALRAISASSRVRIHMEHRSFFQWSSALLASAYAGLLALPVVGLLCEPLGKKRSAGVFRRLVKLDSLAVGTPRRIVLKDQRVDAWTRYSEGAIGAVWAVRTGDNSVDVFAVTCPHLGCPVDSLPEKKQFFCACHAASYGLDGATIAGPQKRGLDRLESRLEKLGNDVWVSVQLARFEPGISEQVPLV